MMIKLSKDTVLQNQAASPSKTDVRRTAMEFLARREHGYVELIRKLVLRFADRERIETVVTQLQQENLQSDERFVDCFIRHAQHKGKGPLYVQAVLAQKGIRSGDLAQWLDSEDDSWRHIAREVKQRKFGTAQAKDFHLRCKQYRFLAQRGFTSTQIQYALCLESLTGYGLS